MAQVAKQEIEEGLHQLETLLESTIDKNFDKFEIYVLRNILAVPEELAGWIQLKHYEVRCQCLHEQSSPLTLMRRACPRSRRTRLRRSLCSSSGAKSPSHSVSGITCGPRYLATTQ